jgi:hypothetical protein
MEALKVYVVLIEENNHKLGVVDVVKLAVTVY